ncbi:MAG: hypothetical protein ACD_60C00127G0006 [uncultured bacterium]|nr:MAG: hypothetical protein ACD_60C00127G0006 [uncultured bacterium]
MISQPSKKGIMLLAGAMLFLCAEAAFAISGIGSVALQAKGNLGAIAQLITAGSYVAGFGFAVGAVVKFKAHKDNPTQIPISMPIALLFVAAALIFIPAVFKASGLTMFGTMSGNVGNISGVQSFR